MNTIESVKIQKFWGDKEVILRFRPDVNFLIGVNGSGKTTIINLIAATLNADFTTLDRINFEKIHIELKPIIKDSKTKKTAFIEVEKAENNSSPFSKILFKIKNYDDNDFKKYNLGDLEEETFIRFRDMNYIYHHSGMRAPSPKSKERDINKAIESLVNVSWLSIHRISSTAKRNEERSFESTIDLKIQELQIELVKYFSLLNRRYALETERFQKYIFTSLIDANPDETFTFERNIDSEKEKASLKQIFKHFEISERNINTKLERFFQIYEASLAKIESNQNLRINDIIHVVGIRKIHSIVQEWQAVLEKQKLINKSKDTFLAVINNLLQRKELFINEKNELTVRTQSGKIFPPTILSSGEKQLLIILGQSLLQEEKVHIYIADEPELSLHVEWQEKLVTSLKSLNPNSQIIFATHSPDIVGKFSNSVIKVEEAIK